MNSADQNTKSILQMVLAAVAFSVMVIFAKTACQTLSSMEVVFIRSISGTLAMAVLIWNKRISWFGNNQKIMVLRGVFGFGALAMHSYAIATLNLATAVILNYTAPIFAAIFARLILREKTSWTVNLAVAVSFLGLYLLASPHFESKFFPLLIGILSGIFAALAYVMIRFGGENESPYTIIFYFTTISTLGSFPLMLSHFEWPNTAEWISLIGLSVGAFFGQVWLTKSIQNAPVSLVLPFSYLTPVFAALIGAFVWQEYLTLPSMVGGILIMLSGIVIYLLRKRVTFIPIEE